MSLVDKLKNAMISGYEYHPWSNKFGIRKIDIVPGFMATANLTEPSTESPSGLIGHTVNFTFKTYPYKKGDGKLYVQITFERTNKTEEMSLWEMGLTPDYELRPKGDKFDPAGWYPWCNCTIDTRDKRWKSWVVSR